MSSLNTSIASPVSILPSSRLKDTKMLALSVTQTREWGLWNSDPTFSNTLSYSLYQVRDVDIGRLDLLSWEFYGTVEYAWCIADANNFKNWITDMNVGDFIRIPNQAVIEAYVRRKGRT